MGILSATSFTIYRKVGTRAVLVAVALALSAANAGAQSSAFPTSYQFDEHWVQTVPTLLKLQARISQAKMPVGDATFTKISVALVKGSVPLCIEEFSNVAVRDSVLNLEIGRNVSCSLGDVLAENTGLSFQVCINGTENCLKPIELGSVPYAIKASYAAIAQGAHTADIAGQSYYAHRATADRNMLTAEKLGIGYFDFETPKSQGTLEFSDFTPYVTNGFISWAPISTDQPRLTVCAMDDATGLPMPLDELVLYANQTTMKGSLDVDGAAHVVGSAQIGGSAQIDGSARIKGSTYIGGSEYVDGSAEVKGAAKFKKGITVEDSDVAGADLVCEGDSVLLGNTQVGQSSNRDGTTLTVYSSTEFVGNVAFTGAVTTKVEHASQADHVPWSGVSDKPITYPPSAHQHAGTEITSAVSSATYASRVPWWGVDGKPSSYPPSTHQHSGADITSAVSNARYANEAGQVPWNGVTGKPASFLSSTHRHGPSQLDIAPTTLEAAGSPACTTNSPKVCFLTVVRGYSAETTSAAAAMRGCVLEPNGSQWCLYPDVPPGGRMHCRAMCF